MKLKHLVQLSIILLVAVLFFEGMSLDRQARIKTFFNNLASHSFKTGSNQLTGNIKIVGRQMIVDGAPFIMKGICYNPVRKGGTHPSGLITLHPTAEDLAAIEKDFQMMHDAGINTIRTYEPLLDKSILDLLIKYQLRTIVPALNYHGAPFQKVTSIVLTLKNHPSTLIWEVGNEWNYNYFYSKNSDASNPEGLGFTQSLLLVKNAAHYIKTMDTTHPVSTVIGGLPKDESFWAALHFKGIDIYGINVYDGLTFGDRLQKWTSLSDKPLYISEFGADAFNSIINAEDDISQEIATRSLVKEIQGNLSAINSNHVLLGGCIFEWNDEWWKDPKGSPDTHDTGGLTEPNQGPYPDYVFNEEWWGIVDIDRQPRPAYYTLKELYLAK